MCGFILLGVFFSSFLKYFPSKQKNGSLNSFIIYKYSLVSRDHWHWMEEDKHAQSQL